MRLSLVSVLCGVLACGPAWAGPVEPGKEGELAKLVPPREGERACYGRVYSADHLKGHPKQRVSEIGLRLAYYVHEPASDLPKGQYNYYFEMTTRLKGHSKPLKAAGECMPEAGSIGCQVECDGGGVRIQRRGATGILIDFGSAAGGRIRMSEGCDAEDEAAIELEPGADDKEFLLSRLPDAECPIFDDW